MKTWKCMVLSLALCAAFLAAGMGSAVAEVQGDTPPAVQGQIYLYGEMHGEKILLDKEFELWKNYYDTEGMRHLFLEKPYYSAAFLNLWMQSDNDDILLQVHEETASTASYGSDTLTFFRRIKEECPETIFHGTDVGHQYDTTGARFIAYLEEKGLRDSEQYLLAKEAIAQGEQFYEDVDFAYREDRMVENFIRAFDSLHGESVMGIYGGAHTDADAMDYETGTVPSMAMQLKERYGDALHTEDLYWMLKDIAPLREDEIMVDGKAYKASYFGKEDMTGFGDFTYREVWRLEDAYEDLKNNPTNDDVLPYGNYPMLIHIGEVFVVDIGKTDGSTQRLYFRSDGNIWEDMEVTDQFLIE